MNNILYMQLIEPEIYKGNVKYGEFSWMLSGAVNTEIKKVWAFTELKRDDSLGRVFPDLKSMDNDRFEIELAAEFATKWPLPENENEWCFDINLGGQVKPLVISNQMIKIYTHAGIPKEDATIWYLPGPLYKVFIEQGGISEEDISVDKCNGFAAMRFIINGKDAQEALDNNLWDIKDIFIEYIDKYV